jgi:hypothetical protein
MIEFNSFLLSLEYFSEFSPSFVSSHFATIWQPPQLS